MLSKDYSELFSIKRRKLQQLVKINKNNYNILTIVKLIRWQAVLLRLKAGIKPVTKLVTNCPNSMKYIPSQTPALYWKNSFSKVTNKEEEITMYPFLVFFSVTDFGPTLRRQVCFSHSADHLNKVYQGFINYIRGMSSSYLN